MKVKISYFYQIRNFKPNQIPISTALWDPKWFHNNENSSTVFLDKRGVINGLRFKQFVPNNKISSLCKGNKNCSNLNPDSCGYLRGYYEQVSELDFEAVMDSLTGIGDVYQEKLDIEDEPEIILIVFETPSNKCSEREVLIKYFKDNGYVLEEFVKD